MVVFNNRDQQEKPWFSKYFNIFNTIMASQEGHVRKERSLKATEHPIDIYP